MTNAGERGGGASTTAAGPPARSESGRRAAGAIRLGRRLGNNRPARWLTRHGRPLVTGWPGRLRGLWSLAGRHRAFTVVLAGGTLLRMIAMLGYRPASWFNDSFDYLHAAMAPYPHPIRPDGYPFMLWLLRPFHSLELVVAIQHLMGLACAVMIYALLRSRYRLPWWGATLATVPLLYDGYEIQLEHLILSDTLFLLLLVASVTLVLWHGKSLSWKMGGLVGLLVGLMWLTRSVGEPVLFAVVVYLLMRRVRWRVIGATVLLCALPVAAYEGWFWSWYGRPGMTMSSGVFLYARVSEFADCNKIKPPVSEYPLCKDRKNSHTPLVFSQDAIWDRNSPFHRIPSSKFTNFQNQLAGDFAKRAIIAQPVDYLKVVGKDFAFTFKPVRTVFPDRATYDMYQFGKKSAALPTWRISQDRTAASEAHSYEGGNARTRIVDPWSSTIRVYQRFVSLPGTALAGILVVGLAGMVPLWRRWGGEAFLPWITATGLLLAPAATAEFDYRYVLPTVPLACMAAAIAFSEEPRRRIAARFRRRTTEPAVETSPPRDAVPV